ncbi:cytochrome P450 [Umezawaea beigongshangensis]|uniref:cytochrome P450 n=1 Tax=Umezawaea beigongshangensis TaxID=2780383 RepID=UPI0027DB44D4|nr:cytochrome P450 [Umezawaea beigongshangensis]
MSTSRAQPDGADRAGGVIAMAPGALPVLGHAVALLRDPIGFLWSLPEHGDLVRVRMGPVDAVVVCDPALTRQLLLDDRTFDKGGPFFERVVEIMGNGLAGCPHRDHRRLRRLLQPAFRTDRMPGYAAIMAGEIDEVLRGWRDGATLDVFGELSALTSRMLVATVFSDTIPPRALRDAREDIVHLAEALSVRMFLPAWADRLPLPMNRRFDRALRRLRATAAGVVAERRASGVDRGDLLSGLLAARDAESADAGRGLSDTEVVDQVVTFAIAGVETVSSTLSWALHVLATRPDVQRRLHEEVDAVLAGRAPAHGDLPALPVTAAIFDETLRLWPPGWLLTRETSVDTTLGGHRFPRGSTIAYSAVTVQNRDDVFPDATVFDLDRWGPSRPPPPRTGYIPFAVGARKCIGDRFALTEAVLVLASVAGRWRLDPVSYRPVRTVPSAALRPRLALRVTART